MKVTQRLSVQGRAYGELIGAKIPEAKFKVFMKKATANFGVDYMNEKSMDYEKMKMLYEQIVEENWTEQEFDNRCLSFFREVKYATWVLADFLNVKRPKLYPREWYLEQVDKNRSANFEIYNINGVFLYKFLDGEEFDIKPVSIIKNDELIYM